MDKDYLIKFAIDAEKNAYAPYSKFKVGASLLSSDGEIFTGCNIENMSYSATVCAERVAIYTAVSEGVTDFDALCVYHSGKQLAMPCGMCLQVLSEFVQGDDFLIIVASDSEIKEFTLNELLPNKFNGLSED